MTAPQKKSWVKGDLYLAIDNSAAAAPLQEPIDFNYDLGQSEEAMPFAGASVTPNIMLLSSPSVQINYNRRADEDVVMTAARHCRDNLTGVRFYLYIDSDNEAAVYAYGMAFVKPSLSGGATSGIKGSFTLIPDESATWDDDALSG